MVVSPSPARGVYRVGPVLYREAMKKRVSVFPEPFTVTVDGQTNQGLTEQQAWEFVLMECGRSRMSHVTMCQGDRIVASRKHEIVRRAWRACRAPPRPITRSNLSCSSSPVLG